MLLFDGAPLAAEQVVSSLTGISILAAAVMPWATETFHQLRLHARFIAALPEPTRAALPRHPRRPALAVLGSTRFEIAVWRSFRRDFPDDPAPVVALTQRMRASLHREIVWVSGFLLTLGVLLGTGWRPGLS